jgi:nicotinamide-nucleotide amidase
VDVEQITLFALPGIPSEVKAIFKGSIATFFAQVSGGSGFFEKSVHVEGVMESSLAPLIDRVMLDNEGVYVKSHPKGRESVPCIEVHFSVATDDGGVAEDILRKAVGQLSCLVGEVVGSVIFG